MSASAPAASSSAPAASSLSHEMEPNTLFIKVERLRRLYRSDEHVFTVRRGEDDTFGLGLSEDNEIVTFYHQANSHVLRLGDQIRMVGNTPLVRERLATLLQRQHAGEETVELHISRSTEEPTRKNGNDVFAALQLQSSDGTEIDEWLSELWTLRTDAVWGTFWTLPIVGGSHAAWLGIHESNMFTEPLMGGVLLPLASLQKEKLDCRWYSLRAEDASPGQREIVGEVLLTTRCFYSSASVCPDRRDGSESDSDYELDPSIPIDHATEPMAPIPEPDAWGSLGAPRR